MTPELEKRVKDLEMKNLTLSRAVDKLISEKFKIIRHLNLIHQVVRVLGPAVADLQREIVFTQLATEDRDKNS